MGKIILNGKEYVTSTTRGFPPLIYSDDEREVGVWRDGKPLYQKCINLSSSTSVYANTWTTIYTDALIGSIEQLICCLYINSNNGGVYNSFYYKPNGNNLQVYISSGFDFTSNNKLIIQYTKTTDTAGSGKYSAVGDLMHHYSTTEQVVGTWIDGSTLYEKTKVIPVSSTSVINKIREIPFLETGQVLKRIVYAFANDATYGDISLGTQTYVSNSNMSNNWGFCRWYGGLAIYTTNTAYWGNLSDITVIYQYTKSSS